MKAIILEAPGDISKLVMTDVEMPVIQQGEVLVQVKAISINPVDVKTRAGRGAYMKIRNEHPIIIGWDISGVVTASEAPAFKPGDEVFGLVRFPGHGKAYAAYVAAPASQLSLKPMGTTHIEAAAATLAALTAYQTLVKTGNVQAGQSVLIHAAAGGVGHFAVQMAKYLGAHVTGTSSAGNKDFVLGLGADEHIDYKTYDWQSSDKEFDFVLDTIGGSNIDNSLMVTKPGGTLISIPSGMNEDAAEKAKAKGVNGYSFLVHANGEDMHTIAVYLQQGIIKPAIYQVFDFGDMAKAHEQVESGKTVGKVVVTIG